MEGLSFIIKCHLFQTKTSCFGVVMLSDALDKSITLLNKLILNKLIPKVMLLCKM